MNIFQKLERFVTETFKTTLEIFLEALKLSPNAQGYVSGSITELLLKNKMEEEYGCEVQRIREKWEGKKHPNHHGDFYFRRNGESPWFVLESKGVKSNSEKWHKLYNYDKMVKFLFNHSEKISWIDQHKDIEPQIEDWLNEHLPKFQNDYLETLYDYEEVKKYKTPNRETDKSKSIDKLRDHSREEIAEMIEERLAYVMSKIKVLETHFVSGRSGSSERTQATPRKDEFNMISIDIFLRHTEHKFVFANPKQLESSGDDANHLQQNYIMGFLFAQPDNSWRLELSDEWSEDFEGVYDTLDEIDAVNADDRQIDNRNIIVDN